MLTTLNDVLIPGRKGKYAAVHAVKAAVIQNMEGFDE